MSEKKTKNSRRKYDSAFKEEVLKMVFNGRPVREVAQSLGIGENIIYRWKSCYMQQEHQGETKLSNFHEVEVLNKRIKELEMERDILKKALSIFSRST
jgi:transposase